MLKVRKNLLRYFLVMLVIFLTMFAFTVPSFTATKMVPYLNGVGPLAINVMVECDSTTTVTVEYGTTTAYGLSTTTTGTTATNASPVTYVHNINLKNLTPNTTYHYRVKQGTDPYSADYTFTTFPSTGTGFKFVFMADNRTGTSIYNSIMNAVKTYNPAFILNAGDISLDGTYANFKNQFFTSAALSNYSYIPFLLAPGNHETWGVNAKAFTQSPTNGFSGTQDYYSFNAGDAHFIEVNTQLDYSVGSAQYNFVQTDLTNNASKPWKFVFFHKPAYVSGGHTEDAGMKTMSTNLFEPNNITMALTGHSHFYQHNRVNSIDHFVIGGGGAPLDTPTAASYTVKQSQSYCYSTFDMTPTTLHMVVKSDTGAVLETIDK